MEHVEKVRYVLKCLTEICIHIITLGRTLAPMCPVYWPELDGKGQMYMLAAGHSPILPT